MAEAYLGLGANLGDPLAALAEARRLLSDHARIAAASSLYRTPPFGVVDQPDFVNQVLRLETGLSPQALLDLCLAIERQMGRVRQRRWGPRLIDIDVLLYGDEAVDTPQLTLPHPGLSERAFVLVPLLEIAPDLAIGGRALKQALAALAVDDIVKLAE